MAKLLFKKLIATLKRFNSTLVNCPKFCTISWNFLSVRSDETVPQLKFVRRGYVERYLVATLNKSQMYHIKIGIMGKYRSC